MLKVTSRLVNLVCACNFRAQQFMDTRWEGKDFLFAMNGQTGKLVGKLPVSTKRVVGLFAAIAALLIAISVTALLLLAR